MRTNELIDAGVPNPEHLRRARIVCEVILVAIILGFLLFLLVMDDRVYTGAHSPERIESVRRTLEDVGSIATLAVLVIMPMWMAFGGARSSLWYWLPPFMPWGFLATTKEARWFLVILLELGTAFALIGSMTDWLDWVPGVR